jgi:hypothetical protein
MDIRPLTPINRRTLTIGVRSPLPPRRSIGPPDLVPHRAGHPFFVDTSAPSIEQWPRHIRFRVWGIAMKKGLRSRLAQYGDEEFALFLRRGFLKGAGFTDEALDRPIVGIRASSRRSHFAWRPHGWSATVRVSDRVAARGILVPDLDAVAKPDGNGRRGDDQGAAA